MLEEAVPEAYALAGDLTVADPAALKLRLVFDYRDEGNYHALLLNGREASLLRVSAGQSTALGICRPAPLQAGATLPLTIQRDRWRIVAILGGQVIARGWDGELLGGQAGYAVSGGQLDSPFVQPLGEMFLSDDFMRPEDAESNWEPLRGSWETQSLRVDEQSERMEAEKSMNAFSYLGKSGGDGPAVAATGYWFWSNYAVSAAVRAEGTDALGVIAYLQDADNYLAARWTSAHSRQADGDRLSLLLVRDGQSTVLGEVPGGHLPGQWYELELRVCDDIIQCAVDGETRLVVRAETFGQGRPGLYCEGSDGTLFDSVLVRPWEIVTDDFSTPAPGRWLAAGGSWNYEDGRMRSVGEAERMFLLGGPGWNRYVYSADLYLAGSGGVGLVVCARPKVNYVLRFGVGSAAYAGKAQVVLLRDDRARELASAPARLKAKSWHRAAVTVEDGLITVFLDGQRLFDVYDAQALDGRVGLYADSSAPALFDNVQLALLPARRSTRLTKEFTEDAEHPEMAEWATTRAPWIKPPEGGPQIWWTKGDYYGDKQIRFAIPGVGTTGGSVRLTVDSCPEDPSLGLAVIIEATEGSKKLTVRLLAGQQQIDAAEVEVHNDPCPVLIERRGTFFVVKIDDKLVFSIQR